ncbi:MAG TPA: acetylxylan esterase [Fimbriimonas sp.]
MPMLDMPLAELEVYQGKNPRPGDFDAFWDRSLAEMQATDPQVTLSPASFQTPAAECFDLTFTGVGGARIYAKYARPRKLRGKAPAILQFHGYSWHGGEWNEKLSWIANGFCVAALDCRGQGGRSEDPGGVKGTTLNGHIIRGLDDSPEKLLYRSIFLDCAQLARIVMGMDEVDETRVGAAGGSQGGGLTLACAALEPRVARIAPTFPFLSDYYRVWEMDLDQNAYAELRTFLKFFDPRHEREHEVFERLGYIDVQHLAPRIRAEVLMGTGLLDSVTPPSTVFAAYNKIGSKKRMVVYPDYGHEALLGFGDMSYEFLMQM